MGNTLIKIAVPVIGLAAALVIAFAGYFVVQSWWSQPPAVLGFGDGPTQPIAFPHTVHVTTAGLDCQFCHRTVSTDEAASVPAVAQCRFCHDFTRITGEQSESPTAEAEIANLRRISWDSLRMQFTTIFAPGALEGAPQTFIATVRAAPGAESRLTAGMAKVLPNVSAIRVKDALDRAAELLVRIGLAVRAVAAVGLAAGLAVLAGAIAAGRRRRERDAVIFKVLGATRRDLARSYLAEFLILGAVAAMIGTALGLAAGYVLLEEVMGLAWTAPLRPALATAATAVALTALFGFVGTWRVLGRPAAPALRQADR